MDTETKIKPLEDDKSVKIDETSVTEGEKGSFKHLDLELKNINPYLRGGLAE